MHLATHANHTLHLAMDNVGHNVLVAHTVPNPVWASRDDSRSNVTLYQTPCAPSPEALNPIPPNKIPMSPANSDPCQAHWVLQNTFYGSPHGQTLVDVSHDNEAAVSPSPLSLGGFMDASSDAAVVATLTSSDYFMDFPFYDPNPLYSPNVDTYNQLLVWTDAILHAITPPTKRLFNDVAVSTDGTIVAATTRYEVMVYNTVNGTTAWRDVPGADNEAGGILSVALSGNAAIIAMSITNRRNTGDAGYLNDLVLLVDATSLEILQTIEMTGSDEWIYDRDGGADWKPVALSHDASRLALNAYSVTRNQTDPNDFLDSNYGPYIYDRNASGVWNFVEFDLPDEIRGQPGTLQPARSIVMTPDGSRIATAYDEYNIQRRETGLVVILDFDPTEGWIVNSTIRNEDMYLQYGCRQSFGASLSFSADGKRLAASDLCGRPNNYVRPRLGDDGSVTVFEQQLDGTWTNVDDYPTLPDVDDYHESLTSMFDRSSFGTRNTLSADGQTLLVTDPGTLNPLGQPTGAVFRYTFQPDSCS